MLPIPPLSKVDNCQAAMKGRRKQFMWTDQFPFLQQTKIKTEKHDVHRPEPQIIYGKFSVLQKKKK
jgi:hypothetical protein